MNNVIVIIVVMVIDTGTTDIASSINTAVITEDIGDLGSVGKSTAETVDVTIKIADITEEMGSYTLSLRMKMDVLYSQ